LKISTLRNVDDFCLIKQKNSCHTNNADFKTSGFGLNFFERILLPKFKTSRDHRGHNLDHITALRLSNKH